MAQNMDMLWMAQKNAQILLEKNDGSQMISFKRILSAYIWTRTVPIVHVLYGGRDGFGGCTSSLGCYWDVLDVGYGGYGAEYGGLNGE